MDPALIALIGTLAGAVLFKLFEHVAGKENRRDQEFQASLKRDIRLDTIQLRTQLKEKDEYLDELDDEIGRLRGKYFKLVDAVARQDLKAAQKLIQEE